MELKVHFAFLESSIWASTVSPLEATPAVATFISTERGAVELHLWPSSLGWCIVRLIFNPPGERFWESFIQKRGILRTAHGQARQRATEELWRVWSMIQLHVSIDMTSLSDTVRIIYSLMQALIEECLTLVR